MADNKKNKAKQHKDFEPEVQAEAPEENREEAQNGSQNEPLHSEVPKKKKKAEAAQPDISIGGAPQKAAKPQRPSQKDYSVPTKTKSSTGKKKTSHGKKKEEERKLRISTAKDAPFNYAEAYRSLRTNINFIASTEDVKSIVVTSALPQESKSNVAINIAISLATEGKKVILVDCDLRKPVVHQYLKMGRHRDGLTEVLSGKAELEDCIAKFKDVKISVLPAGAIPPNPSELLSQKRMKALIRALENNFDYVIIDAPPVSVVTDAAIISSYVDGVVLVVRSKFASIEAVQLAKKRLVDVNAKLLGAVVTRYDAKKSTKSTGYSYTYDYNYHYGYSTNEE